MFAWKNAAVLSRDVLPVRVLAWPRTGPLGGA